jgi:hypothetical protein
MLDARHTVLDALIQHAVTRDGIINEGGFIVDFDGAIAHKLAADNVFIELTFVFKLGKTLFAFVKNHLKKTYGFLLILPFF